MNKRVVRRLLETFFRRWWLYLVPLLCFATVGLMKGMNTHSGYKAGGVIDVSKGTLLSQLTSIRGENFGYETPAAATSRTMNSLLGTDQFLDAVAEEAGLTDELDSGLLTDFDLRSAVHASPSGDTLLRVVATTDNPELSATLAKATIDSFIDYTVKGDVSESRAAETFFGKQLERYRGELEQAQADLADFAAAHPGGPQDERPLAEQVEVDRLRSVVEQAQAQYTTAQQKSDEARLATDKSMSDVSERLRIVDQPKVPTVPEPRLQQAVFSVLLYTIVGLLISFGAVVLATVMDRAVRFPDDVETVLGVSFLAAFPVVVRSRRSRRASRNRSSQRMAAATAASSRGVVASAPRGRSSGGRETSTAVARASVGSDRRQNGRGSGTDQGDRVLGAVGRRSDTEAANP